MLMQPLDGSLHHYVNPLPSNQTLILGLSPLSLDPKTTGCSWVWGTMLTVAAWSRSLKIFDCWDQQVQKFVQ